MTHRLQRSAIVDDPPYQDMNAVTSAVMLDTMLKANVRHELVYLYVRTGLVVDVGQQIPPDRAQACHVALECWNRLGVKQRREALGEICRWVRANLPFEEDSPSGLSH
jgi:hypothetical protein